jgi:hypothetical protein
MGEAQPSADRALRSLEQDPCRATGRHRLIEVGGDPTFVDRMAYEVQSLDWSGPKWVDDRLTLTREPSST